MSKKFIDNIILLSKDVVHLSFEKYADKSTEEMQVTLTINMNDNEPRKEFLEGDEPSINVTLDLEIRDAAGEQKSLFKFHANILMKVRFSKKMTFKKSIASDYPAEILSLVYDDFRFIAEESINRTTFRGFSLPVDFRSALPI